MSSSTKSYGTTSSLKHTQTNDAMPTAPSYSETIETPLIHNLLTEKQIIRIREIFLCNHAKRLTKKELFEAFTLVKVVIPQEEFDILFKKINLARDGFVTWDEFISYLILLFNQEDISTEFKSLEPPIPVLPVMQRSNHRHPINRIAFSPTVRPDRTVTWHGGSIMTCSKDGTINYWSLDMHIERTVQSTCTTLEIQTTWVLDMVVLPDVGVVCTSSTERQLRFYDTSARKFELRVLFTTMDYVITTMHYAFYQNGEMDSTLFLGDTRGSIMVLYIKSLGRGPFKSTTGTPLLQVNFDQVLKNKVPGFRVVNFGIKHSDFIRQLSYYRSLNSIVSCSACPKNAVLVIDLAQTKPDYSYKIPTGGCWCFDIETSSHLIATGGPDSLARIWNPFMPNKPVAIFYGHHSGIVQMVLQDGGKKLYSLSTDKCIKIWDVVNQSCLQTYVGLPQELGEHSDMTTLYNPQSRQWIIGSSMIAVVPLSPKLDGEHTDGNTHVGGVSVVLYNHLYKVVVTCGLDSYIIVWNPWDGRRMCTIKNAHVKVADGENIPIEITAACFDPGDQRLLTGAHDGTLKIWNFNTGTCLRNMKVGYQCEVTTVIWVSNRIMAIGWNRRVTEFSDSGEAVGLGGAFSKNWDLRHNEDISAAAVRIPQTLATTTYNGELILWQLETGQAYKQHNVSEPTKRIKITYKPLQIHDKAMDKLATCQKKARQKLADEMKKRHQSIIAGEPRASLKSTKSTASSQKEAYKPAKAKSKQISQNAQSQAKPQEQRKTLVARQSITGSNRGAYGSGGSGAPSRVGAQPSVAAAGGRMTRRISCVVMPEECVPLRKLAVHSLLFLCSRPVNPKVGTLLVSLENGNIQVWSHHILGEFLYSFQAVHKGGDYVISMTSDKNDEFLFTGTSIGYIKIWLLKNFITETEEKICMPKYRLLFPFLWKDTFTGRAKRFTRNQEQPILLSCFKAHRMAVSGITYLQEPEIILTCSSDSSCRMWTLGGRYLQTLGTFKPWKRIPTEKNPTLIKFNYELPPDIKRIASATTYRVLVGGTIKKALTQKELKEMANKQNTQIDHRKIFGQRLEDPYLNTFEFPQRNVKPPDLELDTTFSFIPVYQHLIMPDLKPMVRPPTPPLVKELATVESKSPI